MSVPLTPDRLAAVYTCLRTFPPFSRLRLPTAEHIKFHVSKHRDREGHYTRYLRTNKHFITLSGAKLGHFSSVVEAMAHEMIHLYQGIHKTETPKTVHSSEFRGIAARACRRFGWDVKTFIGTE